MRSMTNEERARRLREQQDKAAKPPRQYQPMESNAEILGSEKFINQLFKVEEFDDDRPY